MPNPYSVLGVPETADEKAIKSAFRKLAKQFHPDQNSNNPNAKQKFAEVNQAYEILGDQDKRARFDRGEIDEKGNPRFTGFQNSDGGNPFAGFRGGTHSQHGNPFGSEGFQGAEDILNSIFGGNPAGGFGAAGFGKSAPFGKPGPSRPTSRAPSLDVEIKTVVTIEDLMRGKTPVTLPNGKQISASVPPQIEDGKTIRLKGQGKSAPGRPAGDLFITIVIKQDGKFRKHGTDLKTELPLPLKTAVLGGKIAVETPDGRISLKIPPGTSSGKLFRLRGRGLPKKGGGFGDLLVSTSLMLPEEDLDALADFLRTPETGK